MFFNPDDDKNITLSSYWAKAASAALISIFLAFSLTPVFTVRPCIWGLCVMQCATVSVYALACTDACCAHPLRDGQAELKG